MRDYDVAQWVVTNPTSIRGLVERIDECPFDTVFVVDSQGRLQASVTDGDVRRALLAGHGLDSSANHAFNTDFLSLVEGEQNAQRIADGSARGLGELPIIDASGVLVAVECQFVRKEPSRRPNRVVIMAGGKGLRLRPLTSRTPKPLLVVGNKPILQHIIESLRDDGFSDFVLAVNYLGQQIEEYFTDGSSLGITIEYLREEKELGTAGALSLLNHRVSHPVVVMNGDLVVSASISKMVDQHELMGAKVTVGAISLETQIPFGVLETTGQWVTSITEKPVYRDLVNAGIYVVNPEVLKLVPHNQKLDMPELIASQIATESVSVFPMHETWADLGRKADLDRASEIVQGRNL